MATENNPNRKPKKLTKLGSKSKPPEIPNVIEQVPDWLRMLLGKYGEAEGKLVGLQETPPDFLDDLQGAPAVPFQSPTAEADELSALLEQMAEEGGPDPAGARPTTSVEWGDYPHPDAPPLDSAVTGLSAQDQGEIPDWLNELDTPVAQPQADDVPDWLNETAPLPTQEEQLDAPITGLDVPDWLNETTPLPAPDQPDASITAADSDDWLYDSTAESGEVSAEDDYSIPDWIGAPSADEPAAEASPPSTDDDEFDIPDWLASMAPPAAGVAAATMQPEPEAEPDTAADITDWDVPDWISAGVSEPGTEAEATAFTDAFVDELSTAETDIPDWLTDESPEVAQPAEDDIPDWLASPLPEEESPAEDWMAGLREQMDTGAEPAYDEELDLPDWLTPADDSALEPEPGEATSALPDWLSAEPEVSEVPFIVPDAEDNLVGDIPPAATASDEAFESKIPDWLDSEAEEVEVVDRLAQLPEQSEPEEDTPDWLAELPAVEADEEAEEDDSGLNLGVLGAVGAAGLAAGAVAISAEEEEELPDWLAELPAVEESAEGEAIAEEESAPDWLSELPEQSEPEEDTPDWLAELPAVEADEEAEEDDSGLNLGVLGAVGAAGLAAGAVAISAEEEEELPDWLAELPAVEETAEGEAIAEEESAPDWLSELPEADDEEDTPDWLAELPAVEESAEGEAIAEEESAPDWLSELPEADDEEDTPDWLAELPAVETDEEDDSGLNLGVLGAVGAAGIAAGAAAISAEEEEEELPDWLSELPEADEEEDTPDWLAELPAVEADEEAEEDDSGLNLGVLGAVGAAGLAAGAVAISAEEEEELPDWLAELPAVEESAEGEAIAEEESAPDWLSELPEADEEDTPDWLAELPAVEETAEGEAIAEEESAPDWLMGLQQSIAASAEMGQHDDEVPDWLAELPTPDDAEEDSSLQWPPPGADDAAAPFEADSDELPPFEDDELEIPDWLGKASLDDLETPDWLKDATEEQPPPGGVAASGSDWMSGLRQSAAAGPDWLESDDDTELPDWPEEGDAPSKKSEGESSPDALTVEASDTAGGSPEPPAPTSSDSDEPEAADLPGPVAATALGAAAAAGIGVTAAATAAESAAAGKMAGWLNALQSGDTARLEGELSARTGEATGVFSGISTLLPAEKVTIPTATPVHDADSLAEAARQFHAIATLPPQPAALPKPFGQQEKIAAGFVRSALYLLLLVLITLPLLPPLQKVIDPQSGQRAPWTEPAQEFSDVLDSQRRQLISQQLGLVDLQQPETVALVSFDYTTATQGEMQPLAEAVLGRLKGQGMRIIGVSLEPEGAPITQQTFETLAADRGEAYGDSLVNLGYLPGQVAAVRRLATGQQSLAALPDYATGQPLTVAGSQNWQDVTDLRQVDVVVTLADNPVTARWWVEQLQGAAPADSGNRYILAAVSAAAEPFLTPYRDSEQLDGLLAGIGGAAAIEAGRRTFGPARQMIDSMSLAHLAVVILIAVGTIVGWMPTDDSPGAGASTSPDHTQGINQ